MYKDDPKKKKNHSRESRPNSKVCSNFYKQKVYWRQKTKNQIDIANITPIARTLCIPFGFFFLFLTQASNQLAHTSTNFLKLKFNRSLAGALVSYQPSSVLKSPRQIEAPRRETLHAPQWSEAHSEKECTLPSGKMTQYIKYDICYWKLHNNKQEYHILKSKRKNVNDHT